MELVNDGGNDYGADKYCTCEKYYYPEHTCPLASEVHKNNDPCKCCP